MKKALFLLLAALPVIALANEIDSLKTNADVEHFLTKWFEKKSHHITILSSDTKDAKSAFGNNRFYKIDFDKNGLTDLIVDGGSKFLVLDLGHKNYTLKPIDRGAFFTDKPSIISIDSISALPKIIISHYKYLHDYINDHVLQTDTLIYKFGGLVEYNCDTLKDFSFQKLVFTTTRCFGECPVFEIEINADKSAVYKAIEFNKKDGVFQGNVNSPFFDKLISVLKYINPLTLDSSYTVNWTDDQTAITEIYFNGKVKKIEDYGEIGRYSLIRLYEMLFSLRNKFDEEDE